MRQGKTNLGIRIVIVFLLHRTANLGTAHFLSGRMDGGNALL